MGPFNRLDDVTIHQLIQKYGEHFKGEPRVFRAPGRVNLIGEHTDYNDGFVFPMAIELTTDLVITSREDRLLRIWSENMQELATRSLDNLEREDHWSDYVAGVASVLEGAGYPLMGADIYVASDVPVGAGLSSSAALEVAAARALLSLAGLQLEPVRLAQLSQRAENEFVGMNCGIMDQFIAVHGERDKAIWLDCRSLDYKPVRLPSDRVRVVIGDTMVRHQLGSTEYGKRRAECEEGVGLLAEVYPGIGALRDISLEQFNQVKDRLPEIIRHRCRHVISENDRVQAAVEALHRDDLSRFGSLMNTSHDSLRDDYAVSCTELDTMVAIARGLPGVLGARMTGGGFGGCTVNLVQVDQVDDVCTALARQYEEATGQAPTLYVSSAAPGVHEVTVAVGQS